MTKYTYYKIHLKLPDAENNKINYVGMTKFFNKRKSNHKRNCSNENCNEYNYPVYQYIRANGGWEAWCIEILEIGEYNNNLEASKRERYWYELEGGELNYQIPAREIKEYWAGYYNINKNKIQEYRAANKERMQQYNREYYQRKKKSS
jgi:hypothetical protein